MLTERLLTIATSVAIVLNSALNHYDTSFSRTEIANVQDKVSIRSIVPDVLIDEIVPFELSKELFFSSIYTDDIKTRNLLELLFSKDFVKDSKFIEGFFDSQLNQEFVNFAMKRENQALAEGIIQKFVINNHPFLVHVSYRFRIDDFLKTNTNDLVEYIGKEVVNEFRKKLSTIKSLNGEIRIHLKYLLHLSTKVYTIECIQDAINYAWISLLPPKFLVVERYDGSDMKNYIAVLIKRSKRHLNELQIEELTERSRAAGYGLFNEIRPERLLSYQIFNERGIEKGNAESLNGIIQWDLHDFVEGLESNDFKCYLMFVKQKISLSEFYVQYIIQNYSKPRSSFAWKSLFYTSLYDLIAEFPEKGRSIWNEMFQESSCNISEMFLLQELNSDKIKEIIRDGHLSTLRLILTSSDHDLDREIVKELFIESIKSGRRKIVEFFVNNQLIIPWARAVQIAVHLDYPDIFWMLIGKWPSVIDNSVTTRLGRVNNIFFYPGFYKHVIKEHVFQALKVAENCFYIAVEYDILEYAHFIKQVVDNSEAETLLDLLAKSYKKNNLIMAGYILKLGKKLPFYKLLGTGFNGKWLELLLIHRPDVISKNSSATKQIMEGRTDDLGSALEAIAITSNFEAFDSLNGPFMEYIRTCKNFKHLLQAFKYACEHNNRRIHDLLLEERPVLSLIFTRAIK